MLAKKVNTEDVVQFAQFLMRHEDTFGYTEELKSLVLAKSLEYLTIPQLPAEADINTSTSFELFLQAFDGVIDDNVVGEEATLDKVKETISFGLRGIANKTSRLYLNFLQVGLKKAIKRIDERGNTNDYTQSAVPNLPNIQHTTQLIRDLNTIASFFEECVQSPKLINTKSLTRLLDSIGIDTKDNLTNKHKWRRLTAKVGGAVIYTILSTSTGVLGVAGLALSVMAGSRLSEIGFAIHKRGWRSNDQIKDALEQVYELSTRLSSMHLEIERINKLSLKAINPKDVADFKTANTMLAIIEPAYRKTVNMLGRALVQTVRITSKDINEAIPKFIVEKDKSKRRLSEDDY